MDIRMRYFWSALIFTTLCLGCISKNKTEYNLKIPREKLVSILTDVYMAEAALIEYENNLQDSMRKMFVTEIFTIQDIEKTFFDTTMAELSKNAELYKDIHNQVLDSLKNKVDENIEETE